MRQTFSLQVAKALVYKGVTHGQRGESEEELAAYDAVVERFGASDAPDIQVRVARALVNKGFTHGQRGESEEELAACDAVVERFGASDAPELQVQGGCHGQALVEQGRWSRTASAASPRRTAGSLRRGGRAFRRQRCARPSA